jgi:release factor glutamine methyltransferase
VNIKDVLDKSINFLKNKNIDNARFEAEYLLQKLLDYPSRVDLYLNFEKPLSEKETLAYRDYIVRKSKLEPSAYILGYKWFYEYKFLVGPGVLIPRPETEFLVEQAILFAKLELNEKKDISIADLGSGSGCVGLATALEIIKSSPGTQVSLDLYEASDEAIRYINQNISLLNPENIVNINVVKSNLNVMQSLSKTYDIILANPPYINFNSPEVAKDVHTFEPHLALYCEEEGFECIGRWSTLAFNSLKNKSIYGIEISHDQSKKTEMFFSKSFSFNEIKILKDHNNIERIIIAKKKS